MIAVDAGVEDRDVLPRAAIAHAPGLRRPDERPALSQGRPMEPVLVHREHVRVRRRSLQRGFVHFRRNEGHVLVLAHVLQTVRGKIAQSAILRRLDRGLVLRGCGSSRHAHLEDDADAALLPRLLGELLDLHFARLRLPRQRGRERQRNCGERSKRDAVEAHRLPGAMGCASESAATAATCGEVSRTSSASGPAVKASWGRLRKRRRSA